MTGELEREKILNRLLEAATERWDRAEVEKMRPMFEMAADAVWKVEKFPIRPEEEPAYPTTIFYLGGHKEGKKTAEK